MKAKQFSLLFLISITAVVVYAAFHFMSKSNSSTLRLQLPAISNTLPVITVNEQRLEQISKDIFLLNQSESTESSYLDMTALGYNSLNSEVATDKSSGEVEQFKSYDVSMAILFDGNRYCVINNHFYQEGDIIANNVIVKNIENERVLISEHGKEKWYAIANGLQKPKGKHDEKPSLSYR